MDRILELEKKLVPFGTLVLLGAGRLGSRFLNRILQVHRGGFAKILIFDGGTVGENDYFHIQLGAKPGENKALLFERIFSVSGYREVKGYPLDFSEKSFPFIRGASVVVSTVAGGNTLPLIASVARFSLSLEIPFITTNGVFGFGDEDIYIFEGLSSVSCGPALFLKEMDIPDGDITFVGTGKLIKDELPISPIILDRIADIISTIALKKLYRRENERTG